jgi:hypothetical protein
MLSLKNLPPDIIYELTKYLCLKDICTLQICSRELYESIYNFQNNILSRELIKSIKYKQDNCSRKEVLESAFYGFLHYNLIYNLYRYRSSLCYPSGIILQNIILTDNGISLPSFVQNSYVNKLFDRIFKFYVYNNYCNIKFYPNKLELCGLYNFLQIEIVQNKYETEYFINFLKSVKYDKYEDVKMRYYNSIIDSYHTDIYSVPFDSMFKMSSDVTSIAMIKKLIGYKALDLSKARLNLCCLSCNEEAIFEICHIKRSLYNDELISHNYTQFKDLLRRENPYYYTFTTNRETFLINEMIYVKNPITNRRMRVNGGLYKRMIGTLSDVNTNENCEGEYYANKILRHVTRKQNYLRTKFFT